MLCCVQLRLVTVTFCDVNVVWCYILSQYQLFYMGRFRTVFPVLYKTGNLTIKLSSKWWNNSTIHRGGGMPVVRRWEVWLANISYRYTWYLKGQCHEIFCSWFLSYISFPPAPEYPIRTVSNFFENSRRYSQLKVDHRCRWHRWQIKKTFNQKNFKNFVGTPLDSRVSI